MKLISAITQPYYRYRLMAAMDLAVKQVGAAKEDAEIAFKIYPAEEASQKLIQRHRSTLCETMDRLNRRIKQTDDFELKVLALRISEVVAVTVIGFTLRGLQEHQ